MNAGTPILTFPLDGGRDSFRGFLIVESAPLPSSRSQPGPRTRRRFWFPKASLTQSWGLDSGCGRKDEGIFSDN